MTSLSLARLCGLFMLCMPVGQALATEAMADTLDQLKVESSVQPLAVDAAQPRFGWIIHSARRDSVQTSYRLLVASRPDRLRIGQADVWDSGQRQTAQSYGAVYSGPALHSATRYYWRVIVDTSAGQTSARSWFETGLLDEAAWGASQWIGKPASVTILAAPLLRRMFHIAPGLRSARLYVAAGGYADVSINGQPVSDAVLSPGFTDYRKRVQYVTDDVTALLHADADNAIGMQLGRGFFGLTNPDVWHWERAPWHGEPRVRAMLRLTYRDGHRQDVVSDEQWQWADGATTLDDLYGGEDYDARRVQPGFDTTVFDASHWQHAALLPAPKGVLQAQTQQPIKVIQRLPALSINQPRPGVFVYDFGRVIAGWVSVRAQGQAGDVLTLRYGEKLLDDGSVDARDAHHYFKHGFQTDHYTLAGRQNESWHPRFSYKGFRYVEVDGWPSQTQPPPDALTAQIVHSDVAITGHFSSSNPLLNWLHTATVDTMLNNLYGIPTDTPMYEKNGWTGDGMLGADMFLLNFDADALLSKWVQDIEDTRRPDGAPLLIAPNPGWGTVRAPTWHAAYVLVPWALYLHDGNVRVLAQHVDGMAAYVDMEYARSPNGIADTELGDWVSPQTDPGGENAPEDKRVAATAYLYRMAIVMAQIERVLGNTSQAAHFQDMAAKVRTSFNQYFFDTAHAVYRGEHDQGYRQTHNLLALALGLAPAAQRPQIAEGIADDVRQHGYHLDTGALGTKILLPVLTAYGHADAAWQIAVQTTFPSWGFWRANGATSLWEHWKLASRSRGHYFLGTVDDWLYADVAGLRSADASDDSSGPAPGWQHIEIDPRLVDWLDQAAADVMTPYGKAAVTWSRRSGQLSITVDIPVGATARVHAPVASLQGLLESGQPVRQAVGVHGITRCDDGLCIALGSGHYVFQMPYAAPEEASFKP